MTEKVSAQAGPQIIPGYPPNRVPYTGTGYHNQVVPALAQNPLSNMQNLKAALPAAAHTGLETSNDGRQSYSNPLMVLPSGQTVPLASLYGQHQNGAVDSASHLSYMTNGIYSNFVGNHGLGNASLTAYSWPYGLGTNGPAMDSARRPSWSSNEENVHVSQPMNNAVSTECYNGLPYMPVTASTSQHYIAGPIQPMKCADNKSYEMVNLDELVSRDPPIPRAVPALWTNQEELSLAKCLQNPEGITNVYIRGFMPDTTDEDLDRWASRFGEIESCKAIIEQDTGKCKGFGFVMYYSPAAAENCIRGFFHLGFQASYAQKSRNSRLKDLEDKTSTNIYCTGVPIEWNESDLAKHFLPFHAISTKICRDVPSGVSKEVGFARFESREIAERAIKEFHGVHVDHDGVKLCLRFADTKAQKQLKQQSQERRNWRSREYSFSVEHTPSPTLTRLQSAGNHISPAGSYQSPAGASTTFTPATSVSPPEAAHANKSMHSARTTAWPMNGGLQSITNTGVRASSMPSRVYADGGSKNTVSSIPEGKETTKTPSPKAVTIKIEPASGKENVTASPRSN
ncbi:hypothetical protein DV736_g4029, partial [Chaetothyriales sp. CBS 134916]